MYDIYDLVQEFVNTDGQGIFVARYPKTLGMEKWLEMMNKVIILKPVEIWCIDCIKFIQYDKKKSINEEELEIIIDQKYNLQNIKIIGVTGSFGKSSTAFYTYKLLQKLKKSVF